MPLSPSPHRSLMVVAFAALTSLAALDAAVTATPLALVVCAPGYPGSTVEAQPTMDAFAAALDAAAGWSPGALAAVYHEDESAGLERLRSDAALGLVPLPFYLEHGKALDLRPVVTAVPQGGEATAVWSLVTGKGGHVGAPTSNDYEIVGLDVYPAFLSLMMRRTSAPLGAYRATRSGAVLSALRRAANGEKVAVLLDPVQAAAVPKLAFAAQLETVATSPPLPSSVLCAIGGRVDAKRLVALRQALLHLDKTQAGSEALAGMRLSRFVPFDGQLVEAIEPRRAPKP